jgi:anti-sigma-K factor RskA
MMGKERDLDAAERALGTLPVAGESARQRREREEWERRFAGLLSGIEPVDPPAGMFSRITERLAHEETRRNLRRERARAQRWQGFALLTGMAAAGLAALAFLPALDRGAEAARYVAVVTSDADGSPGMVVEFDTGSGLATVIPVGATAPAGKDIQMWHLPEGETKPVSIGLFPDDPTSRASFRAGPGDIFALSYEDIGGSPTGQPTDARYHGEIVRVE